MEARQSALGFINQRIYPLGLDIIIKQVNRFTGLLPIIMINYIYNN